MVGFIFLSVNLLVRNLHYLVCLILTVILCSLANIRCRIFSLFECRLFCARSSWMLRRILVGILSRAIVLSVFVFMIFTPRVSVAKPKRNDLWLTFFTCTTMLYYSYYFLIIYWLLAILLYKIMYSMYCLNLSIYYGHSEILRFVSTEK